MGARVSAVVVAVLVVFGLVGCGGGGSGVAGGGEAGASPGRSVSAEDAQLKFAQCMRENGVNIPDPGPDGELRLPAEEIDRGALEKAREKCRLDLPGAGK